MLIIRTMYVPFVNMIMVNICAIDRCRIPKSWLVSKFAEDKHQSLKRNICNLLHYFCRIYRIYI